MRVAVIEFSGSTMQQVFSLRHSKKRIDLDQRNQLSGLAGKGKGKRKNLSNKVKAYWAKVLIKRVLSRNPKF
ncbi:conserved hypothetical protein [Ricinus communis]|uniref:Uncharacterized protein n=1 Tax=Ricinus communis TaxID=3988 RepID=B9SMS3_RICCO|nr:conserved hypothetical protein [Ricinus communis]